MAASQKARIGHKAVDEFRRAMHPERIPSAA